ncbi:DNA primase large subunit Spp2 [Dispira parvispora]|uniref:DNA primase large subunit Spp2 n=1 Tax=Dispira parvispora TaxID=1520584 RepID=A0A9W8E4L9_9FUNG|nr:DNA primase large subunit Spp2 [Dispira parvispora]
MFKPKKPISNQPTQGSTGIRFNLSKAKPKQPFGISKKPLGASKTTKCNAFGQSPATLEEKQEERELLTGVTEDGQLELKNAPKTPSSTNAPLVIPLPEGGDWRQKRRKLLESTTKQLLNPDANTTGVVDQAEGLKKLTTEKQYGLLVSTAKSTNDVAIKSIGTDNASVNQTKPESTDGIPLPSLPHDTHDTPSLTDVETAALRHELSKQPTEPSLDDYERISRDDFAAALLRGMSWNDGEGIGRNRKVRKNPTSLPQSRPTHLGLGAQPPPLPPSSSHSKDGPPRLPPKKGPNSS